MLLQSHSRALLAVTLFLTVSALFLIYRTRYLRESGYGYRLHAIQGGEDFPGGIGNETLGFQKIFVINAPWRPDRKDAIALAASYSGVKLDWIDGVARSDMEEKAFPPGNHNTITDGNKGSWRAHMNALGAVIQQNLTTALILEDDADWDIRIKSQLSEFSVAARRLPQLLRETKKQSDSIHGKLSAAEAAKRSSIPHTSLPQGSIPKDNGYGLEWDLLWLGHCGAHLPRASPHQPNRITFSNDGTVPEPQHLRPMGRAEQDEIGHVYPAHTRVAHQANRTLCTIAVAVTQLGARKLLYEFGIRDFSQGYDFGLSDFCDGLAPSGEKESRPLCLTVQPPLFSHHFPLKMTSDITGHGAGYVAGEETRYVRRSVRMNLERLVKGAAEEGFEEQWPDSV